MWRPSTIVGGIALCSSVLATAIVIFLHIFFADEQLDIRWMALVAAIFDVGSVVGLIATLIISSKALSSVLLHISVKIVAVIVFSIIMTVTASGATIVMLIQMDTTPAQFRQSPIASCAFSLRIPSYALLSITLTLQLSHLLLLLLAKGEQVKHFSTLAKVRQDYLAGDIQTRMIRDIASVDSSRKSKSIKSLPDLPQTPPQPQPSLHALSPQTAHSTSPLIHSNLAQPFQPVSAQQRRASSGRQPARQSISQDARGYCDTHHAGSFLSSPIIPTPNTGDLDDWNTSRAGRQSVDFMMDLFPSKPALAVDTTRPSEASASARNSPFNGLFQHRPQIHSHPYIHRHLEMQRTQSMQPMQPMQSMQPLRPLSPYLPSPSETLRMSLTELSFPPSPDTLSVYSTQSHVHPLFRGTNRLPPPSVKPGSVITASLPLLRSPSGIQTTASSPTVPSVSRTRHYSDGRYPSSPVQFSRSPDVGRPRYPPPNTLATPEASTAGEPASLSPASSLLFPLQFSVRQASPLPSDPTESNASSPIPEFILFAGPRSSVARYEKREGLAGDRRSDT